MKTLNYVDISLRKLQAIPLMIEGQFENRSLAMTLNAEMMGYGFMMTQKLFDQVATLSENDISGLYDQLIPALKRLVGADVKYEPMYPNFPRQVLEASDLELYVNAILHYWTLGHWKPEYEKLPRPDAYEKVDYKMVDLASDEDFRGIPAKLLASNESLSEGDKEILKWFVYHLPTMDVDNIPFKENLCYVAGLMLAQGDNINHLVKTSTDVLRIATVLSGGDVSLADNTKFKSLPKRVRRILVKALEGVIRAEDIDRYRNKWIKLAHSLHVGDFSDKVYKVIALVRDNQKIATFNARIEKLLAEKRPLDAANVLRTRAGEFARRLDHVLRLATPSQRPAIVSLFLGCAEQVPTRLLLQVFGHFNTRTANVSKRIAFPKGSLQKAMKITEPLVALDLNLVIQLNQGIQDILEARFANQPDLGRVYIDPSLVYCPLPTQQRSAVDGLRTVARGTKMPLGDKDTLRLFMYWVGRDIDLSATLHDASFKQVDHVSYTNLRHRGIVHSGDITRAPDGASEFIDIPIERSLADGIRYVVMNLYVYSGGNFSEHEKCHVGWMTRSRPNSNEIYEPATVEQCVDMTQETRSAIPVIFDLKERTACWVDLAGGTRFARGGLNVESNRASIQETIECIMDSNNKVNLYQLFAMHMSARGAGLVETPEEADTVFGWSEGATVRPYDINTINADYLA